MVDSGRIVIRCTYLAVFIAIATIPARSTDCNENGVDDAVEIAANPDLDTNRNGTLDACEPQFLRMDASGNGLVDIGDVMYMLSTCIWFGCAPQCWDTWDADDDGRVTISDAIFIVSHLFLDRARKPSPRAPIPECGVDPTSDNFGVCVYPEESCP